MISTKTRKILNRLKDIKGVKIVTWTTEYSQGNFDMKDRHITTTNVETLDRYWNTAQTIGFITRQFTNVIDQHTNLPIKHIYGFVMSGEKLIGLSSEDVRNASETCSYTGKRFPPEKAVQYKNLI